MKVYILLLTVAGLLLLGCTANNSNTGQNSKNNQSSRQSNQPAAATESIREPIRLPEPTPPKNEPVRPPKPAENGKTVAAFYEHLKAKGWKIDRFSPVEVRMFDSEESGSFRDEKNIGYLVMRFENAEKARAKFDMVNETYKKKFGRALIAENFILAIFGTQKGINKPDIIELGESDYRNLQAQLEEFFKAPKSS